LQLRRRPRRVPLPARDESASPRSRRSTRYRTPELAVTSSTGSGAPPAILGQPRPHVTPQEGEDTSMDVAGRGEDRGQLDVSRAFVATSWDGRDRALRDG
jgi:hypothetical protein